CCSPVVIGAPGPGRDRRGGSFMRTIRSRVAVALGAALAAVLAAGAPSAGAYDPAAEAHNYSKTNERQTIYDTPAYRALLAQVSMQNEAAATVMQASDPERSFSGHLCARG